MKKNKINDRPLVSVITPSFNAGKYIEATILSVIAQTYDNWEMIIVDDRSTDNSIDIIKRYDKQEKRIRYVCLEKNSGAAIARNVAIQESEGDYIAFLDTDDQWLPEKLEKQVTFMEENNVAFSYTSYINMNENGQEDGTVVTVPAEVTYKQLLRHNVIGCLTVMLNKNVIGDIEMVDIRTRQDYVLWLELCKRGFRALGMQEPLSKYRIVGDSVSSNKIKMAKQNWKVYREIENLNLITSVFYFIQYAIVKLIKYAKLK